MEELRDRVERFIREHELIPPGGEVTCLVSGGADSTCLWHVLGSLGYRVSALHVNHKLRGPDSDEDARFCAEVLGAEVMELDGRGLSEAALREQRRSVGRAGLRATGHTASDQVETILYRLAASPGRRALLGMPVSEGRLVRPLLGVTREQTGAYCQARGLRWRDDSSNEDQRYARTRVRDDLVAALRAVHPAAEANVLRTAQLLREETELLDALVSEELAGRGSIAIDRLQALPPALARMVVVRLAEQAAGTYVPQAGERVEELIELGRRSGRRELHLGGQAGAVIEGGLLEMVRLPARAPRGRGDARD